MSSRGLVQAILFDNDGVLVDSEPIACAEVARALGELGLAVTSEEIADRYIGISAASMYRDIELHYGLAVSLPEREAINRAVDQRLADVAPVFPVPPYSQ